MPRKPTKTSGASVSVKQATLDLLRGVRHQESVRQSRLDRIAVPQRLARRYRLCAGPAGSLRHRHGRRLCPGHPQRGFCQSAFGRRRRQRARQHLHRPPQPDAAGDHRGPAGALASCRCSRFSMPSAPRNFPVPTSSSRSSRRGPRMCRRRSRAPITWRCSRLAGRPLFRCRSTTGPIQRGRWKSAA